VSAGIESSGDVVAAVLMLFAIRLGARPADADHPYGHRRAENLAALGEAAILTGGGIVVVVEAIGRLAGRWTPCQPWRPDLARARSLVCPRDVQFRFLFSQPCVVMLVLVPLRRCVTIAVPRAGVRRAMAVRRSA
jgi:divalent metal cation (Fe/Co/Zn/Cd) transporter